MFFVASKILAFFTVPSNVLIVIGLLGVVLLLTRFTRLASWLIVTSVVLIAVAGLSPLGNALILPLEQRFPPWDLRAVHRTGLSYWAAQFSPTSQLRAVQCRSTKMRNALRDG